MKQTFIALATLGLTIGTTGTAIAGSPLPAIVDTAIVAPAVAPASIWSGALDFGYGTTSRYSTDSVIEYDPMYGYTIGGFVTGEFASGYQLTID